MNHPSPISLIARRAALALALAGSIGTVAAEHEAAGSTSPPQQKPGVYEDTKVDPPQVREEQGVSYVTGGVGIDAREQIRPIGQDMSLQLVFAEKRSGALMSNVAVRIADAQGKDVLKLEKADPLVFAELPPGTYDVSVTASGETLERKITVPSRGQRTETFHWS